MYTDKFYRSWIGPFDFTEVKIRAHVPAQGGIYQILYRQEVAYVGISTGFILDRLLKHVKGHGNWAAARRIDAATTSPCIRTGLAGFPISQTGL